MRANGRCGSSWRVPSVSSFISAAQDGLKDLHGAIVPGGRHVQQVGEKWIDVDIRKARQGAMRQEGRTGGDEDGAHLRGSVVVAVVAAVFLVGMPGDVIVRGDRPADIGDGDDGSNARA